MAKSERARKRGFQTARRHPRSTLAASEILYGINPVEEALLARRRTLRRLVLREDARSERLTRIQHLGAAAGLTPEWLAPGELELLANSAHHQGVALECGPLPRLSERDALAAASAPNALFVALDQVEDPQNLGAVVRNCAAFGVGGLVVPRDHSSPLSPAASKASAGRLERFPVYEAANLARFLDSCRERRVWVAGTDESGDVKLPGFDQPRPLMIVLGNEGRGLRHLVREKCDYVLSIPTPGAGSLNIASASAVILYHLTCFR
jgi:23S rRNA (guanosine2251-2'-O)-methyltransferase